MPSDALAIPVVAAVLVSFATLSRGEEVHYVAAQRLERQAPDNDTQSAELEEGYCELPSPLEHGRFSPSQKRCPSTTSSMACQMIPGTRVPPNWVIFHSCIPGYKQDNGVTASVCAKGTWTPPLPVCVVNGCHLPEKPKQGSYKAANVCRPHEVGVDVCRNKPGTLVPSSWTIKYTCNTNYYLNTTSELSRCDNTTWLNPVDCLNTKCPRLVSEGVDIQCKKNGIQVPCELPMEVDTEATMRCKQFYETSIPSFGGHFNTSCQNSGEWTHPLLECKSMCGINQGPLIRDENLPRKGQSTWLASVYKYYIESRTHSLICGGTLITSHIVLTAAHCLVDRVDGQKKPKPASDLKVGLANFYANNPISVIAYVRKVIVHEAYLANEDKYYRNIGLLDLEHENRMRSVHVTSFPMPACLDLSGALRLRHHSKGLVAGVRDNELGFASEGILASNMSIVYNENCKKIIQEQSSYAYLMRSSVCSTVIDGSEPGPGDSGEGLIVLNNGKNFVVGILSHKINSTYIITDVTYTEDGNWLENNINRLTSTHRANVISIQ